MNNLFLDNIKSQINSSVSMEDICHLLNMDITSKGFAKCPFHGDSRPSMKIYPGTRGYYCFACGAGGDVIGFVKDYLRVSTTDAMKYICDNFGIPFEGELNAKMRENAERRRRGAEEKLKRKQQLLDEYHYWLDLFIKCDQIINDYAAHDNKVELPVDYIQAQKNIEYFKYRMEMADIERGHG